MRKLYRQTEYGQNEKENKGYLVPASDETIKFDYFMNAIRLKNGESTTDIDVSPAMSIVGRTSDSSSVEVSTVGPTDAELFEGLKSQMLREFAVKENVRELYDALEN